MSDKVLLLDYEYLRGARLANARGDRESYNSFLSDIRADVLGEYQANLDQKIERWMNVTGADYWKQSPCVDFYIQAKMLYRDGFYEATIMMVRSVCEMVCYELIDGVPHTFGSRADIERVNFRKLSRFLHNDAKALPLESFQLLNDLYDIGNSYVHPKADQKPKQDSRVCLLKLVEALWPLFGATPADLKSPYTMQSAYTAFPEICTSYHHMLDFFPSPEAAMKDAIRWGYRAPETADSPERDGR
jgi:hypothetical protein